MTSHRLSAVCALSSGAFVLVWAGPAKAYTWMIRHDYFGCPTCHADVSGGGLLTSYGRAQGDLLLRMRYGNESTSREASSARFDDFEEFDDFDSTDANDTAAPPAESEGEASEPTTSPLWGLLATPSWLLVGGSYRHMTLYEPGQPAPLSTFPMQADLYGSVGIGRFRAAASVGVASVAAGSPHARRAQVTTNQGDGLNMLSRTHWVGAELAPGLVVVRAGRLDLPFGVRIPEHTMWVREATRTDRESDQQHGLVVAYTGDFARAEAMAILGNYQLHPDELRERGYSAYFELKLTKWANAGATSLVTYAHRDFESLDEEVVRQAHGVTGRAAPLRPLVILFEADALVRSNRDLGYVGFLQVDVEVVQGLHFGTTGEVLDAGYQDTGDPFDTLRREPGFGRPGYGGWLTVDWFFLPQLEARIDAVARQTDPFTLLAQLHVYL